MAGLVLLLGVFLVSARGEDAVPGVVKARSFHVMAKDGAALVKLEDSEGFRLGIAGVGSGPIGVQLYNGSWVAQSFGNPCMVFSFFPRPVHEPFSRS